METSQPPPLPSEASTPIIASPIAGFWRRVLAAVIDSILLGAVGWVLGLFFFQQFMHMGGWGRLVGFVVSLLYFVPLNSRIGKGQTLGKRALKIRVTSVTGDTLGVARSFIRSCVLSAPFFLINAPIPLQLLKSTAGVLFSVATFGLGLSIGYLIVFNRRTRQSLHDLIVGSYVVRVGSEQGEKPRMWRGHYVVVGVILLLAGAIPLAADRLAKTTVFAEIMPAYEAILQESEVTSAQVVAGQTYLWDSNHGKRSTSGVNAVIRLNRRIENKKTEADKFARIILNRYQAASSKDSLNIVLVEGYDIGIASAYVRQGFNYSPAEWRQRLGSSAK